mmetsp:Transcript_12184/g.34278  ORF Transcript_12184/g.34278 Transcript_12184/m.34278 type:complete len:219 (+) Transcript_12184:249-905(+)
MSAIARSCSLLAALLVALLATAEGVKLRIFNRECMTKKVESGDHLAGSFVAMAGGRGMFGAKNLFNLQVTDPTGGSQISVTGKSKYKFSFKAKAAGRYEFCLTQNQPKNSHTREGSYAEVLWELHVGHINAHDKASEEHLEDLWDSIDELEDKLEVIQMEQAYQRNLETVQKTASEAVNSRVLTFAFLRSLGLIGTSIAQVIFIRWLFSKRAGKGMLG